MSRYLTADDVHYADRMRHWWGDRWSDNWLRRVKAVRHAAAHPPTDVGRKKTSGRLRARP